MNKLDIDGLVSHLQIAMYNEYIAAKAAGFTVDRPAWICKWLRKNRRSFIPSAMLVAKSILAGEKLMESEGLFNSAEFQYDTYALLLLGKHRVHPSTLPLPKDWLVKVAEAMAIELQANFKQE